MSLPILSTSRVRFSQELQPLDAAKLPCSPNAQGRCCLVGALHTVLEILVPWTLVALLMPVLLLQHANCDQHSKEEEQQCTHVMWMLPLLCNHHHHKYMDWALSTWITTWLLLEMTFFLVMKLKLVYLQSRDPLTESLKASKIMTCEERQVHWDRMMTAVEDNPKNFFQDWFFDISMEQLSVQELQPFVAWACFEDRALEHLSPVELQQLDALVQDALQRTHQTRPVILNHETLASYDSCPSLTNTTTTKTLTTRESSLLDDLSSHSSTTHTPQSSTPIMILDQKQWHGRQQLTSLNHLLQNMLANTNHIPPTQLAHVMNNITRCGQQQLQQQQQPDSVLEQSSSRPKRFKRPTADPLVGIRIAPLVVHVVVFFATQVTTAIMFWMLGFCLYTVDSGGASQPMSYYYRRASSCASTVRPPPVVLIHGIGVGPIAYIHLIYQLITKSGDQDVFLPLIPSVSAFRPWVMPNACLSPHQVATCMAIMLAQHGHGRATFMGHSFGTFYMTYMIKYGPQLGIDIAGLVFLDPVCFCLYDSWLTQRTVYNQPDPGDVSYWIKTDMMVTWSIQRNFSWVQGNLWVQDIPKDIPVAVFLSGEDKIAPSRIQEDYLSRHRNCKITSLEDYHHQVATTRDTKTKTTSWENHDLSVMVFRGYDHGLWLLNPFETILPILDAVKSFAKM